ncbi:alpha-tocopherol transfer protein-like [Contarinia nasturtii]|uniref:alpha-tocopherol transfer protein-like n=1 Tax=Contarinia nasturtii TaxID=265458 RepID=UPI0012D47D56|nr:alpha-tocopherol transfer protein-like [Contarinia nasturtii]
MSDQKKIKLTLNQQSACDALRKSVANSKIVPIQLITNTQLILFIESSDGCVDEAQRTLENYYDAKLQAPEHFAGRDPTSDAVQQCLNNQHYFVLPPDDKNSGCPIIFHQLSNPKISNYHFDNAIKTFFMTIDICLEKYGNLSAERGIIFLFDMRHVRIGHLTRVKIATIRKFFRYVQEAMPAKLREIHVLNVVPFFDKILSLIRPFIRMEILKMLHTYPSNYEMSEFYEKVISKNNLPREFGGNLSPAEEIHQCFRNEFIERIEYFRNDEEQRGLFWDNLPKSSINTYDDQMGKKFVNSFKKLDID